MEPKNIPKLMSFPFITDEEIIKVCFLFIFTKLLFIFYQTKAFHYTLTSNAEYTNLEVAVKIVDHVEANVDPQRYVCFLFFFNL